MTIKTAKTLSFERRCAVADKLKWRSNMVNKAYYKIFPAHLFSFIEILAFITNSGEPEKSLD
jgi:hypothetical protein